MLKSLELAKDDFIKLRDILKINLDFIVTPYGEDD